MVLKKIADLVDSNEMFFFLISIILINIKIIGISSLWQTFDIT